MSFFVTLPSHTSLQEFPNNYASSFKVRLPEPLRLMGDNWQVGLSSLSLPDTDVNLSKLANPNEYIFGETCYIMLGSQRIQKTFNLRFDTLTEYRWPVSDGVSFMKGILKWTDKRFQEENWQSYGFHYKENNQNTCLTWTWQGEDLFLDNSHVARHQYTSGAVQNYSPFVAFNKRVCLKMGWFVETESGFQLGPNLIMSFPNGKVPAKNEVDFVTVPASDPLYFTSDTDANNTTWMFLSMRVNWTFINLNHAFRSVVQDPTRTLHIYSDVGSSTMVGDKIVDLLREVKYDRTTRGQVYFEPRHIQYIPVRREVMDIIEVQVAETAGTGDDLAQFGPGHTLLTLHFKQT